MKGLKEFDFVVFHTPMNEQEKGEIYLVVDGDSPKNEFLAMYKHFSQGRL